MDDDRLPRADMDDDVVVGGEIDAREGRKRARLRRRDPEPVPAGLLELWKKIRSTSSAMRIAVSRRTPSAVSASWTRRSPSCARGHPGRWHSRLRAGACGAHSQRDGGTTSVVRAPLTAADAHLGAMTVARSWKSWRPCQPAISESSDRLSASPAAIAVKTSAPRPIRPHARGRPPGREASARRAGRRRGSARRTAPPQMMNASLWSVEHLVGAGGLGVSSQTPVAKTISVAATSTGASSAQRELGWPLGPVDGPSPCSSARSDSRCWRA